MEVKALGPDGYSERDAVVGDEIGQAFWAQMPGQGDWAFSC